MKYKREHQRSSHITDFKSIYPPSRKGYLLEVVQVFSRVVVLHVVGRNIQTVLWAIVLEVRIEREF